MKLINDIFVHELPLAYARLVELYPAKPWVSYVDALRRDAGDNQLLLKAMRNTNPISFSLADFDAGGDVLLVQHDVKVALAMMAQGLRLIKVADDRSRSHLIGRLRGAFKNPDDMRALRMEFMVALNLLRQGASVEWPNESSGPERFDILATFPSIGTVEFECKSWSEDKGAPIGVEVASRFINPVVELIAKDCLRSLAPGQVMDVSLIISNGLPVNPLSIVKAQKELAGAIRSQSSGIDLGEVSYRCYEVEILKKISGFDLDTQSEFLKKALSQTFAEQTGHLTIALGEERALCIRLVSNKPMTSFSLFVASGKKAVRRQMSGKRPGCLVVCAEGLSPEELRDMTAQKYSLPAVFGSTMFSSEQNQHLACILWMSAMQIKDLGGGRLAEQQVVFAMSASEGPYAKLDVAGFLVPDLEPVMFS